MPSEGRQEAGVCPEHSDLESTETVSPPLLAFLTWVFPHFAGQRHLRGALRAQPPSWQPAGRGWVWAVLWQLDWQLSASLSVPAQLGPDATPQPMTLQKVKPESAPRAGPQRSTFPCKAAIPGGRRGAAAWPDTGWPV